MFSAVDDLVPWATGALCGLVGERSVTGSEGGAQTKFAALVRRLSLDVDMWCPVRDDVSGHRSFCDDGLPLGDRPVVVCQWGNDPRRPTLTLNGHVDVVPEGDVSQWSHPPWEGTVADARVYGRGSCDMKGGLVAAVLAIAALQRTGVDPAVNVMLQSVIGEESGGVGTLAALQRGYDGDAAIILEPTNMAICPVSAGAASFRLHVGGRAAHAAFRRDGISALTLFAGLLPAIEAFETSRHRGFRHAAFPDGALVAPISVGKVNTGDWPSTVPDSLVAEGRLGVLPGEEIADARAAFEQCIATAARGGDWNQVGSPAIEWFEGQFEAASTELDAELVTMLGRAHAHVAGEAPQVRGVPYGSDLRLFTNDAEVPAVLYGPGDPSVAHAADEFVPIEQVRDVAKVMALMLLRPPAVRYGDKA